MLNFTEEKSHFEELDASFSVFCFISEQNDYLLEKFWYLLDVKPHV